MKKYIIIFIFILFIGYFGYLLYHKFFSITSEKFFVQNTVSVVTKKGGEIVSRGVGWKINENTIITAGHTVKYALGEFFVGNEKFSIAHIDSEKDIVYGAKKIDSPISTMIFDSVKEGENIFAYVYRNGKLEKKEGIITQNNVEILAYAPNGEIQKIPNQIMTNIDFIVGDSGTIIWNEKNRPVGMVHIEIK